MWPCLEQVIAHCEMLECARKSQRCRGYLTQVVGGEVDSGEARQVAQNPRQ